MVRGLRWATGEGAVAELVRSREQDLFNSKWFVLR